MVNAPAPVGGLPLPVDKVPAIIFAILYAMLLPLTFYRLFDRRSRTIFLLVTQITSIERVVFFTLRALESHNESKRLNTGLMSYAQNALGMGYLGIANDSVNLLRCLLVNPMFGSATYYQSPAAATEGSLLGPPPPGTPDHPKTRKKIRISLAILTLGFLVAIITTVAANADYSAGFMSQSKADKTETLRLISAALFPVLAAFVVASVVRGMRFPRIARRGLIIIVALTTLLSTVAIYRLSILHYRAESMTSPSPLNKKSAKAAFYIFHVLPEWLAALILLGFNSRKTFGTGPWGDWRRKDETPEQMVIKEAQEAEKALKQPDSSAYMLGDLRKKYQGLRSV